MLQLIRVTFVSSMTVGYSNVETTRERLRCIQYVIISIDNAIAQSAVRIFSSHRIRGPLGKSALHSGSSAIRAIADASAGACLEGTTSPMSTDRTTAGYFTNFRRDDRKPESHGNHKYSTL